VAAVLAVAALARRWGRRGAAAAGLTWADRLGGGALGAAEGALVAALLLLGAGWILGRSHPLLEESRSVAVLERLQTAVRDAEAPLPPVAAPAAPRR